MNSYWQNARNTNVKPNISVRIAPTEDVRPDMRQSRLTRLTGLSGLEDDGDVMEISSRTLVGVCLCVNLEFVSGMECSLLRSSPILPCCCTI